eukprot:scaffold152715_cov20-Tisochrysis_lutea.AAC.5
MAVQACHKSAQHASPRHTTSLTLVACSPAAGEAVLIAIMILPFLCGPHTSSKKGAAIFTAALETGQEY